MTDHYGPFDHPMLDPPSRPPTYLFAEMDAYADAFRKNPEHVDADDAIGFRQLQRVRLRRLDTAQARDLCELWRLCYRARREVKAAATRARVAELWQERDALFSERVSASPDARGRIDARLREIGDEIASAFEARDGRAIAMLP